MCVRGLKACTTSAKCRLHASQQRLQQLRRVQRFDAGEVLDLLPARRARRDEHAARTSSPARPAAACARRSAARRRSAPGRIRRIPPSRSSPRRDRRSCDRRECARAARAREASAPSPSDDSDRAAARSAVRFSDRDAGVRPVHSCSTYSSNSTHASPTIRALRCASPRSSAGASSRTADRQLGSRNTIRSPREAASNNASTFAAAAARASSSSPCEISGRPQQPWAARRTSTPPLSSTSAAAMPISGWL